MKTEIEEYIAAYTDGKKFIAALKDGEKTFLSPQIFPSCLLLIPEVPFLKNNN